MEIALTADIHYGTQTRKKDLEKYISALNKTGVGYLLIAGDLASRGADHDQFKEALEILQKFRGEILFSPGNHDLWTGKGDSFDLLIHKMPAMLEGTNIHLLDNSPVIIDHLGFVGSVGWYDYSFRTVPGVLEELFSNYKFAFDEGKTVFRWDQLTAAQYASKECVVSADGENWHKSTWQDKRFIKWEFTDDQFLNYCIDRLREDIESIYPHVEKIVAITHHLPFKEFVPDIPDPTWGFHRAYLGSSAIGKLLLEYPRVKYAFFGHSHRNRMIQINGLCAGNVYFGETGELILIDI